MANKTMNIGIASSGVDLKVTGSIKNFISITGTAGTSSVPALWTVDTSTAYSNITLETGTQVTVKTTAGADTGVLFNAGGTYHPVTINAGTKLTTHYPAGTMLELVYDAATTLTIPNESGTSTVYTGVWKATGWYDSNNYAYVKAYNETGTFPILGARTAAPASGSTANTYAEASSKATVEVATDGTTTITADNFNGNFVGTAKLPALTFGLGNSSSVSQTLPYSYDGSTAVNVYIYDGTLG